MYKRQIGEQGEEHLYTILLEGKKPVHTEFFTDAFYKLGNVREIEDKTTMAYSKEQLKENYKGSIMEMCIRDSFMPAIRLRITHWQRL